jgi:hypothetical protein
MKNNAFFIFFGFCLCLYLVLSCDRVTEERIRSYIVGFWEDETIYLELTKNSNIAMFWYDGQMVSFESKGEDAKLYDALCQKYNDLNYYKKTRYTKYIGCREYSSNEIISIDVVSNLDFDVEHPAGSSLCDIVRLLSASPIRFIQSGYKETYDWEQCPQEFQKEREFVFCYSCGEYVNLHHHPVHGLLTELNKDDLQLLGCGWDGGFAKFEPPFTYGYFFGYLTFEKEPDVSGVHELTVTVSLANGRKISQTIEKAF